VEYDTAQRAFVVHRKADGGRGPLTVLIGSSVDRPLVNPALVIEASDTPKKVRVWINSKEAQIPVRVGIEHDLDSDQAVVYLEMTAGEPVEIEIEK
jgi:hypothetical protein